MLGIADVAILALMTVGLLRVRVALALAAAVSGFEVLRALRLLEGRHRARLLAFMTVSVALALMGDLWRSDLSAYQEAMALVPVLLAWPFVLALALSPGEGRSRTLELPRSVPLLLVGSAGLWIAGVVATGGVRPWVLDEVLYLMQARRALNPPFMWPIDPNLAPFFQLQLSYVTGGYFNGQYPPAWPMLLGLSPDGLRVGLLLLLHLWLVAATYAFGRIVDRPGTGYLAAILVATSGFELYQSMSFFPHVFAAALILTSGVSLLLGARVRGVRRLGLWAAAGFLQACAFAARPLTALALGLALAVFVLLDGRVTSRRVASMLGALVVGGAGPIAYLMWYNHVTTGGFLRFGYTLANNGLQALGFGIRGFIIYKGEGLPSEHAVSFGPGRAVEQLVTTIQDVVAMFWPGALAVPLLFLARYLGVRPRWRSVLPFLLLPAAYFFYFYQADRYEFSLLPFAMVGTAWLVARLSRERRTVAIAIGTLLVGTNLVDAAGVLMVRQRAASHREPFFEAVESVRGGHPKVLVFVQDTSPGYTEPILQALYRYNLEGSFHGDVVVARDLGAADRALVQAYPGYYPVRLSLVRDEGIRDPWQMRPRVTPLGKAKTTG